MKPYDRTLLEIFAAEQAEHVQRIRALVEDLAAGSTAATQDFQEVLRRAHTLKGAARAVGLEPTESISHRLEALFVRARDAGVALAPAEAAGIHHGLDAIEDVLGAVLGNRGEPDPSGVTKELDALLGTAVPAIHPLAPAPAMLPAAATPSGELVRVRAAYIDELIRTSSQLLAATGAESLAERRATEFAGASGETLTEFLRLRRECSPFLRENSNNPELAPLRECLEYVDQRLRMLSGEARAAEAAQHYRAWELRQRTTELHQNAVRVRMIPAESVFGALGAMARELAHDEAKEIEFRVEGLEVQADRLVLQALKDPVMHLLRNAVSHGIEPPTQRTAAGKPRAGVIRLRIDSRGDRLTLVVSDDGRGLDLHAVANQAVKRGWLSESDVGALTQEELARLIFRPGFSTSDVITSLSGRGMGLSVVEETVSQLQGEIHVRPSDEGGLEITISAALSISTQHILLLAVWGCHFGVPTRFVQRLLRMRLSELAMVEGHEVVPVDSYAIPVVPLADLLGLPEAEAKPQTADREKNPMLSIAVLVSGEERLGLIVDRLIDYREAVVKELGLPAALTGLTAGGVPLEDGTVAVLLNPPMLFERFRKSGKRPGLRKKAEETKKAAPRILVVDDSITTRSLEKSILEAHGYQVSVAVDGLEALEKLSAEPVDLVITDVMMPRMDGLQLLQEMKKQRETAHIPVIIVTSLERTEEQQRGLSLGADAYIVKRKFDQQELLNTVRQIL